MSLAPDWPPAKGKNPVTARDHPGAEVQVYRTTAAANFTVIHNSLLRNDLPRKLTALQRMVLLYLVSLPTQGWRTSRDEIAADFTEGRDQIAKALTALTRAGYFRRTRSNDPATGRLVWRWEVSDQPVFPVQQEDAPATKSRRRRPAGDPQVTPLTENQSLDNQAMGDQSLGCQSMDTLITKKDHKERTPPPPTPSVDSATPAGRSDPPQTGQGVGVDPLPDPHVDAVTFVDALPYGHRRPTASDRTQMAILATAALAAGWAPESLLDALTGDTGTAVHLPAVYLHRLRNLGIPPTPPRTGARCDTHDVPLQLIEPDSDAAPYRGCPSCPQPTLPAPANPPALSAPDRPRPGTTTHVLTPGVPVDGQWSRRCTCGQAFLAGTRGLVDQAANDHRRQTAAHLPEDNHTGTQTEVAQ